MMLEFPTPSPMTLFPSPCSAEVKTSEFWSALESAFGSASGRSLVNDLHLVKFDCTAAEALERGFAVDQVWAALIEESGADPSVRWIHRRPVKGKRGAV